MKAGGLVASVDAQNQMLGIRQLATAASRH
jgi:hypothetical protein